MTLTWFLDTLCWRQTWLNSSKIVTYKVNATVSPAMAWILGGENVKVSFCPTMTVWTVPLLPLVLLVGAGAVVELFPEFLAVAYPESKKQHSIVIIKITWYCAKVLVAEGFIANTIPAWQWLYRQSQYTILIRRKTGNAYLTGFVWAQKNQRGAEAVVGLRVMVNVGWGVVMAGLNPESIAVLLALTHGLVNVDCVTVFWLISICKVQHMTQ